MKGIILERENDIPVYISAHIQQRLKERKGLNRQAIKRYLLDALEFGEILQASFENGGKKIMKMFNNDCLVYFIEKEMICFITILTNKSVKHTIYVQGKTRSLTLKAVPFAQGI